MEGLKLLFQIVKKEGYLIKGKFSNLRVRITIPEVHVEWKEVAESILLILLSLILYMSVVFTQFSFIPIMILTIKRGWREAAFYLAGSILLFIYIMTGNLVRFPFDAGLLLFSPAHYSFEFIGMEVGLKWGRFLDYIFIFGVLGICLGHLVSRNYKLKYVIFLSISLYVGIILFIILLSGVVGGFSNFFNNYSHFVSRKTTSYVNHSLSQIDSYRNVLESRGINYNLIEKKIRVAAELYKNGVVFGINPRGGYLIKQIIVIFLSLILVKLYFKKKLDRAALYFELSDYNIADDWVWGLIISWGLVYLNLYLKSELLGIISWNAATVFSFLYFLKGLTIIKLLAERIKIPQIIQYMILLFLLFYSFILFSAIVTGIGVADIWLCIKENLEKIKNRGDS